MVTPERFAKGMPFQQYAAFVGTPENIQREGSFNRPRRDYTTCAPRIRRGPRVVHLFPVGGKRKP